MPLNAIRHERGGRQRAEREGDLPRYLGGDVRGQSQAGEPGNSDGRYMRGGQRARGLLWYRGREWGGEECTKAEPQRGSERKGSRRKHTASRTGQRRDAGVVMTGGRVFKKKSDWQRRRLWAKQDCNGPYIYHAL